MDEWPNISLLTPEVASSGRGVMGKREGRKSITDSGGIHTTIREIWERDEDVGDWNESIGNTAGKDMVDQGVYGACES